MRALSSYIIKGLLATWVMCIAQVSFGKCPANAVVFAFENDGDFTLSISLEDLKCRKKHIADLLPRTEKQLFCVLHDGLLEISVADKSQPQEPVSVTAIDTFNSAAILAKQGEIDLKILHLRHDDKQLRKQLSSNAKVYSMNK